MHINNGLSNTNIRQLFLLCHSSTDKSVYAGTWGDGVYVTTDEGTSWIKMTNNGLTNLNILSLGYVNTEDSEDILLAGTHGGSIFKIQI